MGVVEGLVIAGAALAGAVAGRALTPNEPTMPTMPEMPTALAEGPGSAEDASTAAGETAKKKATEEQRKRAAYGKKSTMTGASGFLGAAPVGKKTLLGT